MNDKDLMLIIMLPIIVIGYIVVSALSFGCSKSKHALFNHEIDKKAVIERKGGKYFLLKKGDKFRVYIPHETDKFWFKPLWVPLSTICFGYDCGPVKFDTEKEATEAFDKYINDN